MYRKKICYVITWQTCFFSFFLVDGTDHFLWRTAMSDDIDMTFVLFVNIEQCLEGTLTPVSRGRKPLTGRDKQQSDHYSTCSCWYWGDSWKELTRSQLAESHKELQWRKTRSCVTTQRASYTSYIYFNQYTNINQYKPIYCVYCDSEIPIMTMTE